MRAGKLKAVAVLMDSNGKQIGNEKLVDVSDADESIPFNDGLKSGAAITIKSCWLSEIRSGNYWLSSGRLFLINGSSNPDGRKREAVSSVTELIGAPVTIDVEGEDKQALCALTRYMTKPSSNPFDEASERRQAEFANVQYVPVVGHEFNIAGAEYRIIEHDIDESDSVVSRCWIEFIKYT